MRVMVLLLFAGFVRAEFLEIRVFIRDMNCESCSESLSAALKRMRGVESAEVDFKAGTVAVKLAPQNRLGPDQVWDAIKRVGFTPGKTSVCVRGTIRDGKLTVPESQKSFDLEGGPAGGNVEVKGSTAPPPNPRTPIVIRVD